MTEQLLTCRQIADLIGFAPGTIQDWIERGDGPPGFRIAGRLRFRASEVEAWLDQRRLAPRAGVS